MWKSSKIYIVIEAETLPFFDSLSHESSLNMKERWEREEWFYVPVVPMLDDTIPGLVDLFRLNKKVCTLGFEMRKCYPTPQNTNYVCDYGQMSMCPCIILTNEVAPYNRIFVHSRFLRESYLPMQCTVAHIGREKLSVELTMAKTWYLKAHGKEKIADFPMYYFRCITASLSIHYIYEQ